MRKQFAQKYCVGHLAVHSDLETRYKRTDDCHLKIDAFAGEAPKATIDANLQVETRISFFYLRMVIDKTGNFIRVFNVSVSVRYQSSEIDKLSSLTFLDEKISENSYFIDSTQESTNVLIEENLNQNSVSFMNSSQNYFLVYNDIG